MKEDFTCCGQHEVCEKTRYLTQPDIEYYEDEELDRFRGRSSNDYTPEETEEFREVLLTMRTSEVTGWLQSLQMRGVELPDGVKDDVLMIMDEQRGL